MDVARAIAKTATRTAGGFENVPVEPVIIRSVRLAK